MWSLGPGAVAFVRRPMLQTLELLLFWMSFTLDHATVTALNMLGLQAMVPTTSDVIAIATARQSSPST